MPRGDSGPTATRPFLRRPQLDPPVFLGSAGLILLAVALTIAFRQDAAAIFAAIQGFIAERFGWFFVLTANVLLGFCLFLMFGPFGHVRLGGPDAKPDFPLWTWFAMLFSAGMGIGLVFFAVAEPLLHFAAPPPLRLEPDSRAALAQEAMGLTFLHWGLHPWAIYALIGLALAYVGFNKGLPLTVRSIFQPLLGERVNGVLGKLIDILAAVATMFGIATSLGLGVQQISAGLGFAVGLPQSLGTQLALVAVVTLIATVSVGSGIHRGIKMLSELNMLLAAALLLFVVVLGPTLFILDGFIQNLGYYLHNIVRLATWSEAYSGTSWQNSWTVFYYAWWISWSPFVGMFIARISRGRTVRGFVTGVLVVPTLIGFAWLTAFGNGALAVELFGPGGLSEIVQRSVPDALFAFLSTLPWSGLTIVAATLVVITFFVTSSDSGSLVIDIITAGGRYDHPPTQRIFWALVQGAVAAALLVGGGLVALQTASIVAGLPFAAVLLLACWSLYRALSAEGATGR